MTPMHVSATPVSVSVTVVSVVSVGDFVSPLRMMISLDGDVDLLALSSG